MNIQRGAKWAIAAAAIVVASAFGPNATAQSQSGQLPKANQGEPWSYSCKGDRCTMGASILNDDNPSITAMELNLTVGRKSQTVREVYFRFPTQAKGRDLYFAFAKIGKDASGQPKIDLIRGSARVLKITTCGLKECRLSLPKGLLAASKGVDPMNVGKAMRTHDVMLIHYPSSQDTYGAEITLVGLQSRERQLFEALP